MSQQPVKTSEIRCVRTADLIKLCIKARSLQKKLETVGRRVASNGSCSLLAFVTKTRNS